MKWSVLQVVVDLAREVGNLAARSEASIEALLGESFQIQHFSVIRFGD